MSKHPKVEGKTNELSLGWVLKSIRRNRSASKWLSRKPMMEGLEGRALLSGTDPSASTYAPVTTSQYQPAYKPQFSTPTVTLTASTGTTASFGASVTFSVNVSATPDTPVPTMSVFLLDNGFGLSPSQSGNLDGSGNQSFVVSNLAIGTHTLTANYNGDLNYTSNVSSPLVFTITSIGTTTSVVINNDPANFGQNVQITAEVAQTSGFNAPSGSVSFVDGSSTAGPFAVVANGTDSIATFSSSSLSVGTHSISAVFTGSNGFASSSSSVTPLIINSAGTHISTNVTFVNIPSPAFENQGLQINGNINVTGGTGTPTGIVTFTDNGTTIGSVSPGSGITQTGFNFFYSNLSPGTQTIAAVYSGDSNYAASSTSKTLVVESQGTLVTTATNISSPTTGTFGQLDPFTANVTIPGSGYGNLSGSITFMDGSTTLASGLSATTTDDISGNPIGVSATLQTASLLPGAHTLTAIYSGDGNYATSTSAPFVFTVNSAASNVTVTTLHAGPSNTVSGQTVKLSGTVLVQSGTATGTVVFTEGLSTIGVGTLSAGIANFYTNTLPQGTHTIVATYSGDGSFNTSSSQASQITVGKASTTTNVTTFNSLPNLGQEVQIFATVFVEGPNPPQAGGTVTFLDGSSTLATVSSQTINGTLSNSYEFLTNALSVGTHNITAVYNGDNGTLASTSGAATITVASVGSTSSTSTLSISPTTVDFGNNPSFTVSVTGSGPTPTGTVDFYDSSTYIGSGFLDPTGHVTNPSVNGSNLALGTHTITAKYTGDSSHASSTSTPATLTIIATTFMSLNLQQSTGNLGQAIVIDANVSSQLSSNLETGTVTIFNNGTSISSGSPDSSGDYQIGVSNLSVGTHTITATFTGTGGFQNSSGGPSTVTISSIGSTTSTIAVTGGPNPADLTQSITYTATVTGGSGTPTGTVNFMKSSNEQETIPLNGSGQAVFSLPASQIGLGSISLSATYNGNSTYGRSNTTGVTQTITLAPTTTSITFSTSGTGGQDRFYDNLKLTATVSGNGGPTGTVTFFDSGTSIGTATMDNGIAQFTTSSLSIATHTITGVYSGDSTFATSTSSVLSVQVKKTQTTTSLAVNPVSPGSGQTITLSASVTSNTIGVPTGTVTFLENTSITLGSSTLTAGLATFNTVLSAGSYTLTAVYSGDATYNNTNSPGTPLTVSTIPTVVSLQANPAVAGLGTAITFSAAVTGTVGNGTPTGTVVFTEASSTLGTGTLSSGVTTFTDSALPAGTYTVLATYSGDSNYNTGSANTIVIVNSNSLTSSTTTLTVDSNPATPGTSVNFTAVVGGVGGPPTGTVSFFDGGHSVGSSTLSSGTATFNINTGLTGLSIGSHTISAIYSGDGTFNASQSSNFPFVVNHAFANPSLSLVPSTVNVGQTSAVTFTASGSFGTPTGTVTFSDGISTFFSSTLNGSGTSASTTPVLPAGNYTITAVYAGDANYAAATITAPFTVSKYSTTTTLGISPTIASFTQNVSLTANVTTGAGTPTGTVTFTNNGTSIGTASLSGTTAVLNTTSLPVGTDTIAAVYNGDSNFQTSTSSISTVMVNKDLTNITLTGAPNPVTVGQTITFSVTVGSTFPGTPSGTITFYDGGSSLNSQTLSSGAASFSSSSLSLGVHTISANYPGDPVFNSGNSNNVIVTVSNLAASTTTVTANPNPVAIGQTVTFSATVHGSGVTPTGSITFFDAGSINIGTAALSGGLATLQISNLGSGSHSITAIYFSNGTYAGSTSAPTSISVATLSTTTSLTVGPNNALAGTALNFTATVSAASGVISGTVTFFDAGTSIGTSTLAGSGSTKTAVFSTSNLLIAVHTITATFQGVTGYTTSSASAQTLLVGTTHQRFVAQLYRDLLGREADSGGLASWTALIDGGQSYAQIAIDITSSREYDGIIVDAFYIEYLHRHAETGGLNSWVDQMQAGLNAEVIRAGILGSQEYYNDTGGTDTLYVTALYQQFLNRAPDPGGLASWVAQLGGNPANRQGVASGISNSDENRTDIITSFYETYLHRAPDGGGLAYWKTQLANGISQPNIISQFVTSPEYLTRYQV